MKTALSIAGPYPTASYPYGRAVARRTVWYVETIARRACLSGSLFPDLPVSAWTVTRYDNAPRKYHIRHESDNSTAHFTAPSFRKAVKMIQESIPLD